MKKLSIVFAFSLLLNATSLFSVFQVTKDAITLKASDCSLFPQSEFLPKIGVDTGECDSMGLIFLSNRLREAGFYPMELDITNKSTKTYRLGLGSIAAKCNTNYRQLDGIVNSLSRGSNLKKVFGATLSVYGTMLAPSGIIIFTDGRSNQTEKELGVLAAAGGSTMAAIGAALLYAASKKDQEDSREFSKYYLQPEDVIIKPGQRIKKFLFLTPQGYNNSNFMVSLINNANPDDIVSFNVPMR